MTAAPDAPLTEEARFPLLTEEGRRLLKRLQEHPHAPRYNHRCGDRLTAEGLARVTEYERRLRELPPAWGPGALPPWVLPFAAFCRQDVPFYRRRGGGDDLASIPPCVRADLSREPWSFVPDSQPLDDLIVYNTAGTTGHPLDVLCHPEFASTYIPLIRRALSFLGVELEGGPDRVGIALICWQKRTFTYATVSAALAGAGFVKINLNPDDWRTPEDRALFLDDLAPEVYSGDPISFLELAKLPLATRPKALVSTALALQPGLRKTIEERFRCPVANVYSMNETGPIAVEQGGVFHLLPHDLHVEVLDAEGRPCAPGTRGEVTLTGGRNPFLPLLRYRTGDFASLSWERERPVLTGLEGRQPVVFRSRAGAPVNSIDVSTALRVLALAEYSLTQRADGSLELQARGAGLKESALRESLLGLFGRDQPLAIEEPSGTEPPDRKQIPFRCDIPWEARY